jgi:peptidyl-prolyl cis-trans isomerase C
MIRKLKYFKITSVVLWLFVIQCNRSKDENVVARVGKSTLTLEELKENIPDAYSEQITRDQNINYVKQWIDRELLFQEAVNQKIDKDPIIKERLDKMKEDLLSAELLHRYSMQIQPDSINDSIVYLYYKKNQNQFVRDKESVKYLDIAIDDSNKAWVVYRTVTKENFVNLASQYSKTPTFDSSKIPYTIIENIPLEIRQSITSLHINSISTPIKTPDGYHIINIIDKRAKGELCSFSEVRREIINQLVTINKKVLVDKVLSELRIKNRVEFNLNLITDSLKNKPFNPRPGV